MQLDYDRYNGLVLFGLNFCVCIPIILNCRGWKFVPIEIRSFGVEWHVGDSSAPRTLKTKTKTKHFAVLCGHKRHFYYLNCFGFSHNA